MASDKDLAAWAALFLQNYQEEETAPDERYAGLTPAAGALLRSVDAGGIPAFMTTHLRQIAEDNGLKVGAGDTPNDVIAALRGKLQAPS